MDAIIAYILGILTILVIFIPLYFFAQSSASINKAYNNIFCINL